MQCRIYVIGAPSPIGGACTELAHTLRLWHNAGLDVHLIPTWLGSVHEDERPWLDALKIPVHPATPDTLDNVPGLPGSTVISFCNAHFFEVYGKLRALGCPLVWVGCMNWSYQTELAVYRKHGCPDAMVFQSAYQRGLLEPQFADFGYSPGSGHLIHGAFDFETWQYAPRPHTPGSDFTIGKLARPDADKWSSNLWRIYERVQYRRKKALVMGLDAEAAKKLGSLPEWAEWRLPGAMPVKDYLASIHAMVTINGGAAENWPRVGLEAFASGVPVVAERQWGWREMIEHSVTGFLASSDEEFAHWTAVLAYDEPLRLRMAAAARDRLVSELAEPGRLMAAWQRLFGSVVRREAAA